ncbi:hypothetical protein A2368_01475 [Candidatus Collierbacteria bacterium RIFOXYB1_FULL_49_13]|uniref:16S rRNA (guanine(1405)-N(7))-methyltransferase n=1 Tax=Candidatus Collierbacteria bacterium RIFOXYB1_FULL_49_13 TaxID=1817728 RepID=A0A1F5FEY9_9BACT|nr:MAG: hypothetical protein A2368_01475 [Candidatus Collierbacteria bacterium RIFOXYB1_FULL_49_13]
MTADEIVTRIVTSAKYKGLHRKTVQRIVDESSNEDEARKRLHQIWGAYFGIRPNFGRMLKKVAEKRGRGETEKEVALWLLQLQSSTKERTGEMEVMYRQIYEATAGAKIVVDYGCGMNGLSHFWWPKEAEWTYLGVDIDLEEIELLRQVTGLNFTLGDALVDDLPRADMYWCLKLLPVLEMQRKGAAEEMMIRIPARWAVVSYPLQSIGGRQKGMEINYNEQFERLVNGKGWKITKLSTQKELVFVVDKSLLAR